MLWTCAACSSTAPMLRGGMSKHTQGVQHRGAMWAHKCERSWGFFFQASERGPAKTVTRGPLRRRRGGPIPWPVLRSGGQAPSMKPSKKGDQRTPPCVAWVGASIGAVWRVS